MNKKLANRLYKNRDRRDFESYPTYKTKTRHNVGSKCGPTGKRVFMSSDSANGFALTIDTKMRSYKCEHCGFFHLTSKVHA